MKRICLALLCMCMMIVTWGCNIKKDNDITLKEYKEPEENFIVFIDRHINYACGYVDFGKFIDSNGNVYSYDYSTYNYNDGDFKTDSDFIDALYEIYERGQPEGFVDGHNVYACFMNVGKIDEKADLISYNVACDAGQETLYILKDRDTMIKLRSSGDNEEQLKDSMAEQICEVYDKLWE